MALLEVNGITKRFEGLVAVSGLSFKLNEGEMVGIIGPNGAGKTTVFNMIAGYYKPNTGSIHFSGQDITGKRPDIISKMGLTRTFQVVKPFAQISVLENVMVGAYNRTNDDQEALEKANEIVHFLKMEPWKDSLAANLPIAGRKRLEIARCLATDPKVILLDEVMAGLRPNETDEMIALTRQISERGIALLIVEHVMKVIMSLAERIIVLHHGVMIAEGDPKEIVKNKAVVDAYLGEAKTDA